MLQLVKRQQIVGSLSPPPGVTPNFQNPESNARTCVIASIVCVIIAALFVLARLWSKLFIVRSPGWDDGKSTYLEPQDLANTKRSNLSHRACM